MQPPKMWNEYEFKQNHEHTRKNSITFNFSCGFFILNLNFITCVCACVKNGIWRMFAWKIDTIERSMGEKKIINNELVFFSLLYMIWNVFHGLMPVAIVHWPNRSRWINWKQMKITLETCMKRKIDVAAAIELKFESNNIYEWPAVGQWRK